jgi:hypothetical protein
MTSRFEHHPKSPIDSEAIEIAYAPLGMPATKLLNQLRPELVVGPSAAVGRSPLMCPVSRP